MSDEQPVPLRKRKLVTSERADGGKVCIVHYSRNDGDCEVRPLTEQSFRRITQTVSIRQQQTSEVLRLDSVCSKVPVVFDESAHGCHRWCYANFTNVSKFATKSDEHPMDNDDDNQTPTTSRRSDRTAGTSTASSVALFPSDQCIFCSKGRKKLRGIYENLTTCQTETAEDSIKQTAAQKEDFALLGRVTGVDLRAREARYHESCRRSYVRDPTREHHATACKTATASDSSSPTIDRKELNEAHLHALMDICNYVQQSTINEGNVERMTMLRDRYMTYLKDHVPQYCHEPIRTSSLKLKLMNHFGAKIKFWLPTRKCTSELVYTADLDTGDAVQTAYEATASEKRILADAAAILRRDIEARHNNAKATPWPPSATDLQLESTKPPESLTEFLSLVISGKSADQSTSRTQRLSKSFSEDICSAATRGRWTVSKHMLLGVTLHHLTGKADVVTMIHRYGHCCSYTGVLELETAMANQVQQQDSVLPSNIATQGNKLVHLCWDNFDLTEETPSGAGTTHSTHGIVVQEVQDCDATTEVPASVPRCKSTKFQPGPEVLRPIARRSNAEPCLPTLSKSNDETPGTTVSTSTVEPSTVEQSTMPCIVPAQTSSNEAQDCKGQLWILCRAFFNNNCTVPDWSGWLSLTCENAIPVNQSRIGYMAPILHSITEYSTVKECLNTSMTVSSKVKQQYTIVTMDLAAAKIAYDLIWAEEDKYQKVLLNLGPFHVMCSYMGAIGKMMSGSGFEDIVVEAGLCASGSIDQVMTGRHYNRAMRIHQRMLDGLERLLLASFQESMPATTVTQSLHAAACLANEPTAVHLCMTCDSDSCMDFVNKYDSLKERVRQGKLGKTAQFWLAYCDCVWTLLSFQRAVKENDLELFVTSMRKMCALLFSADHFHYARYLPVYYVQLCNLEKSHPGAKTLLQDSGFSVARSAVPGCRIAVDQTIEQTVNRSAKTSGGLIGFSRNVGAYYRWCLSRHKRATYVEATFDAVEMMDNVEEAHKSTKPSSRKRSEHDVCQVMETFDHFVNPFNTDEERNAQLFCLSSGQPASETVAVDLCRYVEAGERTASEFIDKRLLSRTVPFHDRLKKMRLKTFKDMAARCSMNASKKKTVEVKAERNVLGNLLMLSQTHDISLERLFRYPLGPIPWALSTADGALVKTNKSQMLHCLEASLEGHTASQPETSVHVIDGNALLQSIVRLPETFEGLAMCVFSSLPKVEVLHFVTDTYVDNSVKDTERVRRGTSPAYLIGGKKTKLPRDFKMFMRNSDNKRLLTKFLLKEWQSDRYAARLCGRTIFFVCEQDCTCLTSEDGLTVKATSVLELISNQEEADTRIILHCLYASQRLASSSGIVVRSPDTDVFVLLVYYSAEIPQPLLFDTGCGNNRRQLDVHKCASELDIHTRSALPAFHAFTGCDSTSAFVRKGKKGPFKLLRNTTSAMNAFSTIGTTCNCIDVTTMKQMENFVCAMYGKPNCCDVNQVRYETFKARFEVNSCKKMLTAHNGIDISLLPPCHTSLKKHCQRVNYQSYIWKHAHLAQVEVSSPVGCGWKMDAGGKLSIDWIEDPLPQQLADIMAQRESQEAHDADDYEDIEEDVIEEDDELDNILDIIFDDDGHEEQ